MAEKKKKYYVVWVGVQPGIYETWAECLAMTKGFPNARFKGYETESLAQRAYHNGPDSELTPRAKTEVVKSKDTFIYPSIAVDGATSGNPGDSEYRGVDTLSHQILFHFGPIYATNNIVEFLAIVHAMGYMLQRNIKMPIYSDSRTAISWVNRGKCKTLLPKNEKTATTLNLIARAERWLAQHPFLERPPLLKWETSSWGEIPADFGRK